MPDSFDSPVVCKVLQMKVYRSDCENSEGDFSGPYEALSYTWGNPDRNHYITWNDKAVGVTENLYSALVHLRLTDKPRYLWSDAICINQNDVDEKNSQVQQIIAIYKGADRVIAWLGTSADDSDFTMEGMKVFDDRANRRDLFDRSHDAKCVQQLRRLYIAQSVLFNRPYFRRSWVRQEVSVAKKVLVYCGKLCVSWSTMKRSSSRLHKIYKKIRTEDSSLGLDPPKETLGLRYIRRNWVWGQTVTGCIGNIRSLWYYHAGGFLDLLMTGRDFNATDPRDKIYSVLGLARVLLGRSLAGVQLG